MKKNRILLGATLAITVLATIISASPVKAYVYPHCGTPVCAGGGSICCYDYVGNYQYKN